MSLHTVRLIRSMAARNFAKNSHRNPVRAERWLIVCERYESIMEGGKP